MRRSPDDVLLARPIPARARGKPSSQAGRTRADTAPGRRWFPRKSFLRVVALKTRPLGSGLLELAAVDELELDASPCR